MNYTNGGSVDVDKVLADDGVVAGVGVAASFTSVSRDNWSKLGLRGAIFFGAFGGGDTFFFNGVVVFPVLVPDVVGSGGGVDNKESFAAGWRGSGVPSPAFYACVRQHYTGRYHMRVIRIGRHQV